MSNENQLESTAEPVEQLSTEDQALANVVSLLQAGQQFYNEQRDENELDLVKVVRDRLFEKGMSDEQLANCYDNSRFVQEANGRHTHAQQWNLTRWVDEQFTLVQAQDGVDTRIYRFQSVYELGTDEWLKVFDNGIAPNLLEFGLRTTGK